LGSQRLHVNDVAGAAAERGGHVGQYPAPVMDRVEALPGEYL
jgi:hypothetical protein